jgi:predicted N-acetyltransferase YhbS
MPETVTIDHLCRHPEHIPRVAAWIHGAFWTRSGKGVETVVGLLHEADDPDRIPLSLLAFAGHEPAGTVQLIVCDSKARPDLTPWLAALYVDPTRRGKGIGASLVGRLVTEANRLGYTEVFLETDIPEFYAPLGATRHEPLADGGWIMRMDLREVAIAIRGGDDHHPPRVG